MSTCPYKDRRIISHSSTITNIQIFLSSLSLATSKSPRLGTHAALLLLETTCPHEWEQVTQDQADTNLHLISTVPILFPTTQ